MSTAPTSTVLVAASGVGRVRHLPSQFSGGNSPDCNVHGRFKAIPESHVSDLPVCRQCLRLADERLMSDLAHIVREEGRRIDLASELRQTAKWMERSGMIPVHLGRTCQPSFSSEEQRCAYLDARDQVRAWMLAAADALDPPRVGEVA